MYNIKEIPYVYRTLFGAPLDIRTVISSLSNLLTELPLKLRYEGLMIYVKDKHLPYIFVNGINDVNCIPLTLLISNTSVLKLQNNALINDEIIEDVIYIDNNSFRYTNSNVNINSIELYDKYTNEKISIEYEKINNNEIIIYSRLRGLYKLKIHI